MSMIKGPTSLAMPGTLRVKPVAIRSRQRCRATYRDDVFGNQFAVLTPVQHGEIGAGTSADTLKPPTRAVSREPLGAAIDVLEADAELTSAERVLAMRADWLRWARGTAGGTGGMVSGRARKRAMTMVLQTGSRALTWNVSVNGQPPAACLGTRLFSRTSTAPVQRDSFVASAAPSSPPAGTGAW